MKTRNWVKIRPRQLIGIRHNTYFITTSLGDNIEWTVGSKPFMKINNIPVVFNY
jgi:hypothetical protein